MAPADIRFRRRDSWLGYPKALAKWQEQVNSLQHQIESVTGQIKKDQNALNKLEAESPVVGD